MWDERYSNKEYAYGIYPNDFLRMNVNAIPKGKVLSLAEGEGRNAVFLAKQGYSVTAVDASIAGIEKAKKLAEKNKVEIEFIHSDLAEYDLGENQWDGVISIFCPLPPSTRKRIHESLIRGLKQNGVFLLEAYTPQQLQRDTGGGNTIELMQSASSLRLELKALAVKHLVELNREVIEGIYHTGLASVVQAIATKHT